MKINLIFICLILFGGFFIYAILSTPIPDEEFKFSHNTNPYRFCNYHNSSYYFKGHWDYTERYCYETKDDILINKRDITSKNGIWVFDFAKSEQSEVEE